MMQMSFLPDDTPDRRKPAEPIARAALVEGNYRRWLKRKWGAGPLVGWAMLNPSNADAMHDDPTLWRIMGFSFRWGYGGLVVGNLYPFITANPATMLRWRAGFAESPAAREAFVRNRYDCAEAFRDCPLLMAAWGNGARQDDVNEWMGAVSSEIGRELSWHCLGRNADGSPKHPLARGARRVPDSQRPMQWMRA